MSSVIVCSRSTLGCLLDGQIEVRTDDYDEDFGASHEILSWISRSWSRANTK